jgi:hypothetical protein
VFPTNGAGRIGYSHAKNMNLCSHIISFTKINSSTKLMQAQTIKPIKGNRRKPKYLGYDNDVEIQHQSHD